MSPIDPSRIDLSPIDLSPIDLSRIDLSGIEVRDGQASVCAATDRPAKEAAK